MNFKDLVKKILRYNKDADLELVEKAFLFVYNSYKGIKRISGDPMIEHNLQVAYILTDYKVDEKTIAAAILHDIIHYNKATKEEIEQEFGKEVAELVDGVSSLTKLKKANIEEKSDFDAANLRKLLMAATRDIRVIYIKLADRLHNMRTIEYLPEKKRLQVSKEVLEIYAPLAYRIGMSSIKRELEDIAFSYLEPKEYNKIKNFVDTNMRNQDITIRKTIKIVEKAMTNNNISGEVMWRVKHLYSIYRKIVDRHYQLENMYDIGGVRIITEKAEDCYKLIQIIHELWQPIPGRFKDYIAIPKENGYQSLHTIVIVDNKPLEFQIRTKEMNDVAEEGVAAHSSYKGVVHTADFDKKLMWIKELLHEQTENNAEFLENAKIDFFGEKICVYTPKGKLIELPVGSTPLDFAYAIHTDIGNNTIGASVNGKFVSLKNELKNGDIVSISTAKNQKPSRDWLKIVKTYRAKTKIRQYLKQKGELVSRGQILHQDSNENAINKEFIIVHGIKNPDVKLSLCCTPLPGDKIVGYKTGLRKVMIHKINCETIKKLKTGPNKEVLINWKEEFDSSVEVFVDGVDRVGFFVEVLNAISSRGYNISDAKGRALKGGYAECSFKLKLTTLKDLTDIIARLKKIKGVTRVYVETVAEKKGKKKRKK